MNTAKVLSFLVAPLIASAGAAEFTAVVAPETAELVVAGPDAAVLGVRYYDWGPGWSNVKRRMATTGGGDETKFTSDNELVATGAAFRVEGAWRKAGANSLRLEASIVPAAASALTMAQFSLSAPEGAGGEAVMEDGSSKPLVFPLARGRIGDRVKSLSVASGGGRKAVIEFDRPVEITAEKDARIVLVRDRMEVGKSYPVAFTITLPGELEFLGDPAKAPPSTAGWYPFEGNSPIPTESEWNMRAWLDAPAGRHGRVLAKEDVLFYHGKPIKLWGINLAYSACAPEAALADRRADFYAALGINAVRLHKYADGTGWSGILSARTATEFDPQALDRMDYFVAALKKRGIYVKLSPVFITPVAPDDIARVPYFKEFAAKKNGWADPKHGSFYLSTELQDIVIRQLASLLGHKNPHTGLTYAEDPAIAYVEFYNEDSALFFGTARVMESSPTLRARAGALFAQWLKKKYGDEAALTAAWGSGALNAGPVLEKLPRDESFDQGRVYPNGNPWFFDPAQLDGVMQPYRQRLLDTMAFLYDLQNEVYARIEKAVRDAGYQGELVASNWQAGRAMSHFYNLSSDARIGTIDRHNYFGGSGGGRLVFNNASMVAIPGGGSLSASMQQVDNRPFMLSEWIHVNPNEWGVEGPAILGAYGMGLQGWDASFAFQNSDEGTFAPVLGRQEWDVVAPQFLGIFPAVSRQVLRGDVKESDVLHFRNVNIAALGEGKVGFTDEVQQQWDIKTFTSDVFPSKALAAARGVVRFTPEFEATASFDMAPYESGEVVSSSTGQLRWTAGKTSQEGHIAINTPGTQAVVGFAKDRAVELADASISPSSRYGAIYLTAQSPEGRLSGDNILVTAISRARNDGTVIVADRFLIKQGNTGKNKKPAGPVLMEPVAAKITLKRAGNATVHILDHNGVRTGKTIPVENGSFQIDTGRDATPYYLVTFSPEAK